MPFVFLSHSTVDKDKIVRPLYEHLVSNGVQCFLDEKDIEWGSSIPEAIRAGLEKIAEDPAGYLLVVISTASLASRWLHHELQEVEMFRSKKDYGYILPVVLPDVDQNKAQRLLGKSTRYIVSDNPTEIGSALVGVISRRHPLKSRIRWTQGERESDSWDFGLLELVRIKGTLTFRWDTDSPRLDALLKIGERSYFQRFESIISPLLDLSEAGLLLRRSGQLLEHRSEEFQITPLGEDIIRTAKQTKCWSWEHRARIDEVRLIPLETVVIELQ